MNAAQHTIHLSATLRTVQLSHSLYDVLTAVAVSQSKQGYATIPGIYIMLGCTFTNVALHLLRNPDLFEEHPVHKPRRFVLSQAAVDILAKVNLGIQRRAAAAARLEGSTVEAS